ncbi:beta-galactosidase 3 [Artemisia annua]|uniref:Beta-galactosidase 3 n=1 Tax=Artemisia annua TaxID=35608 RepID=A0A2U1KUD9_ARTAN|nr:beta-galactosidase 3 [Artemisia annua]
MQKHIENLWMERNSRLFKRKMSTVAEVSSYCLYRSVEAGYLQVQEDNSSVSSTIRSMEDSKCLSYSRGECQNVGAGFNSTINVDTFRQSSPKDLLDATNIKQITVVISSNTDEVLLWKVVDTKYMVQNFTVSNICQSVEVDSSESVLRNAEHPKLLARSTGHALHVFINGELSGFGFRDNGCIGLNSSFKWVIGSFLVVFWVLKI